MKKLLTAWTYFDQKLEDEHPYIAGLIGVIALFGGLYLLMIVGSAVGY